MRVLHGGHSFDHQCGRCQNHRGWLGYSATHARPRKFDHGYGPRVCQDLAGERPTQSAHRLPTDCRKQPLANAGRHNILARVPNVAPMSLVGRKPELVAAAPGKRAGRQLAGGLGGRIAAIADIAGTSPLPISLCRSRHHT